MTDNSVNQKSDQNQPRIVVVGDIMVDVDIHCRAERICQEGPWPVLSQRLNDRADYPRANDYENAILG